VKSYLSTYGLSSFLRGGGGRYSVWLIIISVVTVLGGYVLRNHFWLWGVVLVGITGMLVGGGTYVLRNRKTTHGTHGVRAWKSTPQIAAAWDYRPRDLSLRNPTVIPNGAGKTTYTSGSRNSALNENTNVWFNFASQKSDT
jgi:hypothetical protein